MIGMGETRLEDAYGAAIEALEGFPLFTMTQALRLIGYFGDYKTGDWTNKARHTVAKNAYRLRERGEPNNRIRYLKRQEIIYARTKADQRSWHPADTQMIIKQLDRTEAMIVRLVNTGRSTSRRGSKRYGGGARRKRTEVRLEEMCADVWTRMRKDQAACVRVCSCGGVWNRRCVRAQPCTLSAAVRGLLSVCCV